MKPYIEWIKRARSAYNYAKAEIDDYVTYEDKCFQAQQAVEKAIKGLIIFYGEKHEHTHDIERLIKALTKHVEIDESIKESIVLSIYAFHTRYPGDYHDITEEEYQKAIEIAGNCLAWVEKKIEEMK